MAGFIFFIFIFLFNLFHGNCQSISGVRFLANSSIFSDRDGIVIATLDNGVESSICSYKFTEIDAGVVCRSLGYPANGLSVVSNRRFNKGPVLLGDFQCKGNETHLKHCIHSMMKEYSGPCGSHQMDVHVYCLDEKVTESVPDPITTCNNVPGVTLQRVPGQYNTGFLNLLLDGKQSYVCNDDFKFGLSAARIFCDKMCRNTKNPRPLMYMDRTGFNISTDTSFVKASCKQGECTVYPVQSCDPSYTVGLRCGEEPIVVESSPQISCSHDKMTVTWSNTTVPYINSSMINLSPQCHNISKQDSANGDVIMSLQLGDCSPVIKDEPEYLLYSYIVRRSYAPVGVTKRGTANLVVRCRVVKRKQITGKLEFRPASAAKLQFRPKIFVAMSLCTDGSYSKPLKSGTKAVLDRPMFVKVFLTNPPKDVRLNLDQCVISSNATFASDNVVPLITDMCPVKQHDVQVTYLSPTEIGFQFEPFHFISSQDLPIYIRCQSSKCYVPNDRFCGTCGQNKRTKRSVARKIGDSSVIGPVWIETIDKGATGTQF